MKKVAHQVEGDDAHFGAAEGIGGVEVGAELVKDDQRQAEEEGGERALGFAVVVKEQAGGGGRLGAGFARSGGAFHR